MFLKNKDIYKYIIDSVSILDEIPFDPVPFFPQLYQIISYLMT